MFERNYEAILRDGISAAKNGSRKLAWSLLNQAAQMNPLDARPWLWLTETTDDLKEKRDYLEQALAADPNNMTARRGLAALSGKALPGRELAIGAGVLPRTNGEPIPARADEVFLCPKCGGRLEYNIHTEKTTCLYCGFSPETERERSAADNEQVLGFVLPTEQGHRWAESQQNLVCERCGAHSLWPPEQKAAGCPYCGSHQLLISTETENLVDPQGIAVMQLDEREAVRRAQEWFGRGWFAPDDLAQAAKKHLLQPAYYPFWTFDGTMDIHWSCEINEGSNDHPRWVTQSGVEFEMFDDLLIPGLQAMPLETCNKLGPYNLKDVVEFKSEYLAGWPALTYDQPLAKATLLAREKVVRNVRRELYSRVLPGQQKRNLNTGGINWSDMTFKHILLPVWTGTYHYQGKEYKLMVNGQTGKVTGEKPRDLLKTILILTSVLLSLVVIAAFLLLAADSLGWVRLFAR